MQQELQEHQQRAARIETLIEDISTLPDEQARSTVQELVQLLLDVYGEGLTHIVTLTLQAEKAGHTLVKTFAQDELVGSLLLLHELHPLDIETRVVQALDMLRPSLKSFDGNVEFIRVEDGVAYLRLVKSGAGHGCNSSLATLKTTIKETIHRSVPDLDSVQLEDAGKLARQPDISIASVQVRRRKDLKSV
jgi:Fe-S cluster biogenesis protein NfuA